jgi:class 3 adenylate cyclase
MTMTAEQRDNYITCLLRAQEFEMFWRCYHDCFGQELEKETRHAAGRFFEIFDKLPELRDGVRGNFGSSSSVVKCAFSDCEAELRKWANSPSINLFISDEAYSKVSRFHVQLFFFFVGFVFRAFFELERRPIMVQPTLLEEYRKWGAHLPTVRDGGGLGELMVAASKETSIALVGDIRNSHSMMTSESPRDFSNWMDEFLSKTRQLLRKHGALFDKFTGDGFIAYFSDAICSRHGASGRDVSFVAFIREYLQFSTPFFRKWGSTLKQRSTEPIGLGMGADLGVVSFENPNYHFVAVGEAIVLASRLVDVARAEEILVSEAVYETLSSISDLTFENRHLKHDKLPQPNPNWAWSMSLL